MKCIVTTNAHIVYVNIAMAAHFCIRVVEVMSTTICPISCTMQPSKTTCLLSDVVQDPPATILVWTLCPEYNAYTL